MFYCGVGTGYKYCYVFLTGLSSIGHSMLGRAPKGIANNRLGLLVPHVGPRSCRALELFPGRMYTRLCMSLVLSLVFRSTSKSRPNNIRGGKCPSVRTSVRPSVRPQKVSSISMKFGIQVEVDE